MEHDEHEGLDEASLKEHEEVTKVKVGKNLPPLAHCSPPPMIQPGLTTTCGTLGAHAHDQNIQTVELGRHVMETWYFSPFPKEYFPMGFVDRVSTQPDPSPAQKHAGGISPHDRRLIF